MLPFELSVGSTQALLAGSAVALTASVALIIRLRRIAPEERERRRRLEVNRHRRSVEGLLSEASPEMIHYQYDLRGVSYFASQDVSGLRERLPADPSRLIGPVSVRYAPKNPANSIVVCEDWSGLPAPVPEFEKTEVTEENMRCN
ncbi:MAG: hypothetical protein M9913_07025 [Bryobacteraceae bacterium]|nr:hypothetical protein [Solibacteraceae bacterium]MCO5350635.1 hypothetical protein [Bryobacteraceae bacterium]